MPDNRNMQQDSTIKNGRNLKRRKPSVSSGKAFGLGLLAAIIVAFVSGGALIMYSMVRDANTQAQQEQTAREQLEMFNDTIASSGLTPAKDSVNAALSANANITVIREETASDRAVGDAVEQGTTDGSEDSGDEGSNEGDETPQENADGGEEEAAVTDNNSTAASDDESAEGIGSDTATNEQQAGEERNDDGTMVVNGAGIVLTSTGDILTNNHVVDGAQSITVTIGGKTYDADITGTDPTSDLATIKLVDAKDLPVAKIGDSSTLREGEWLMAVGNPFGLNDSVSTGCVSYLGRDIKMSADRVDIMYANMIQTDVPFNPGNSGGGVYNNAGECIGIATMITTSDESMSSVGYAIPINYAQRIAQNLMKGKPGAHAVLGLSLSNVPDEDVETYGLESTDGAYITNITKSGPSEAAGLSLGDIIVSFNDEPVKNADDLLFKVRALDINTTVSIDVLRQGKEMSFDLKLGSDV